MGSRDLPFKEILEIERPLFRNKWRESLKNQRKYHCYLQRPCRMFRDRERPVQQEQRKQRNIEVTEAREVSQPERSHFYITEKILEFERYGMLGKGYRVEGEK